MGLAWSNLALGDTDRISNLSPNQADWLTCHADVTGLAVVEVERLWNRFKQLTGSADQIRLNPASSALPNELSNDIFVRNLLVHFPHSSAYIDEIPFGYFILIIQWFENAKIDEKIRAIYYYLNNGDPIDASMLSKLFRHLYPETQQELVTASAIQFMEELGVTETGQLNESQFVSGVLKRVPVNDLEEILNFSIIPSHILDEANAVPSIPPSTTNLRRDDPFATNELISDEQLRLISTRVAQKSWHVLALDLGFLEYDIEAYRVRNNGDSAATMFNILQTWRENKGVLATRNQLKIHLRNSGFVDLVPILD